MKDVFAFLGKEQIFVYSALAFWASVAAIGSFFYPLIFRQIIEGVEQRQALDMQLVAVYAAVMLGTAILIYLGTLAANKYWIILFLRFRTFLVSDFFSLNDREKKDNGIGFYQNRVGHELASAFMVLRADTIQAFIFLARLGFALYIGFFAEQVEKPGVPKMAENGSEFNVLTIELLRGISSVLNRKALPRYLKKNEDLQSRKSGWN